MKKMISFIFLAAVIIINGCIIKSNNNNSNIADDPIKNLYGYWKITSYRWGGITSWNEEQAQKCIEKVLFFSPNKAQLIDRDCKSPKYSFSREENATNYLLEGYRVNPNEIGIKTTDLNVIEVECTEKGNRSGAGFVAHIFIIDKNSVLYRKDSPFFLLTKNKIKLWKILKIKK